MKLLVTGATGFVGSNVVREAKKRGHQIRALVRPTSDRSALDLPEHNFVVGDLTDSESLARAAEGIEAVIHCAAQTPTGRPDLEFSRKINVEGTRRLAEACARSGTPHWIQISSMSAHEGSTSVYGRTKLEADRAVQASGLPCTILRPSIIYGPGGRGIVAKTVAIMRKLPVMPVVGPGTELIRPVLIDDVAAAALDCLEHPQTAGRTYMIGGPNEMELNEFLARLGEAYGVRRPMVHLPIGLAMLLAGVLQRLTKNPPLTTDNVLGVKQAQRVEIKAAITDFGFDPVGFEAGLKLCRQETRQS